MAHCEFNWPLMVSIVSPSHVELFMQTCLRILTQLFLWLNVVAIPIVASADDRPNVIVILSDDQGYGDVGFNGPCDIPTPNLDALAAAGVAFDAGYATHPYCSPSRAGLMTGRYQQRFGHECNPGDGESEPNSGLPLDQTLLSDVFQKAGYRTAMIGKWHLGDAQPFWPINRGFDEWYGFSPGGMSYWGEPRDDKPIFGVLRNGEIVPRSEISHLTDDFSTEAVEFIDRNKANPFFMYLAYNAPHSPDHSTAEHFSHVEHIEDGGRAAYGALVAGMDVGIGRVLDKLKELGLFDNTLIFFYSDNGGRIQNASNLPLRGHKGMLFEGGIRIPFCVSWPVKIPAGERYSSPVSALDIFPTSLAAANIDVPSDVSLDGVNLLPYLSGQESGRPHETLFWRYAMGDNQFGYAVRDGDWKLVDSRYKERVLLFDLKNDPGEWHDLAATESETVQRLTTMIQEWDQANLRPLWLDRHGPNVRKEEAARQKIVDAASRGEK